MEAPRSRRTFIRRAAVGTVALALGAAFLWREGRDRFGKEQERETYYGPTDERQPVVGEPAPGFVLPSLTGEPISSADFRGRILVLNFWATWCPPCRAEMPDLQALSIERQEANDLAVLAVDFLAEDSLEAVRYFVRDFGLTFPIATDTQEGAVAERYGVRGLPVTFFIDRDGILRKINHGPVFGDLLRQGIAAAEGA